MRQDSRSGWWTAILFGGICTAIHYGVFYLVNLLVYKVSPTFNVLTVFPFAVAFPDVISRKTTAEQRKEMTKLMLCSLLGMFIVSAFSGAELAFDNIWIGIFGNWTGCAVAYSYIPPSLLNNGAINSSEERPPTANR